MIVTMSQVEKDRIKEQIETLKGVLENLKKLDQNNPRVSSQVSSVNDQITDYYLELENATQYIPFRKRFFNDFIKSKIIILNTLLIIFEFLNNFTDLFKDTDNQYLKILSIGIPAITIYLRTQVTK